MVTMLDGKPVVTPRSRNPGVSRIQMRTLEERVALLESQVASLLEGKDAESQKGDDSTEKAALVAKALALKEVHPKQVKASPSQIPAMSVEKLTALITDAEALIAAGAQA